MKIILYVDVEQNGDFIYYAYDGTPLVIGNKVTQDYPCYKVTILNSVITSQYYELTKDFFSLYFDEKAIHALAKYRISGSYDHDFITVLLNPFWEKMKPYTVDKTFKIIDDALCNQFEFKVESGGIYFREIMNNL